MSTQKKSINVLIANDSEATPYLDLLSNLFEVNVVKHKEALKGAVTVDLIVFTGGEDVDPSYYDQPTGKFTSINSKRDNVEQSIYYSFRNVPKLGICRGAQFLTVMNGGRLIQHVSGHTQSHNITIEGYGDYMISSTHHQMMYPYNLNAKNYKLVAYSTNFRSTTYLNGENEETTLPVDFLEPEIVEYPSTRTLCIQGHPEFVDTVDRTKEVILELIGDWFSGEEKVVKATQTLKWIQADGREVPQNQRTVKLERARTSPLQGFYNETSFSDTPWHQATKKSLNDRAIESLRSMSNTTMKMQDGTVPQFYSISDLDAITIKKVDPQPTSKSEGLENMF